MLIDFRMEKDALDEALDALDSQHQDEMRELLAVRVALKAQVKDVTSLLDKEKVDSLLLITIFQLG